MFTFIVNTFLIFYLHSSQKSTTFASNLRQRELSAAIAIKPKTINFMKPDVYKLKQQTQDFVLRLFMEGSGDTTPSSSDYCTCSHVGTHARLHS